MEDYPTRDGEYCVCFLLKDGSYGEPDWALFERGEWVLVDRAGWEFESTPVYWASIPMPR
jgi:hypothetical protein